ncbi:MAG: 3-dehydroquinate synthase [Lachnospiraceae bacterium]|nr:3-dehydroquinate synthase [Lachnospiraceae bacterium]
MAAKQKENKIEVKENGAFSYYITLQDSFDRLTEQLAELDCKDRRICIVTDSHVADLYLSEVKSYVEQSCRQVEEFIFPCGEQNKTLDIVRSLYEYLIQHEFDRHDLLIALGGGVVGDLTGYAAATYLRGIRFVQIPTTLLAQVDSSIGGKTGVDFDQYKNMVGAFHQPSLVYINTSILRTLPDDQFANGMGEVLKYGLIRDAGFYEWTIEHMGDIEERDTRVLEYMVERCCQIKRIVVEKDPTEKGERAILNFGHTIGHAIEKLKGFQLLHGQCVALGMVAAAYISWKRGYLDSDEFYEIRDMSVGFDLPITFDGLKSEDIVAATKKDKKMNAGKIRFILLKKMGHAYTDLTVTDEEMLEAVNSMNADLM